MLMDLPAPDLQAYHDYYLRLQQQQRRQQQQQRRERGLIQSFYQDMDKDKDQGKEKAGKRGSRWWWWGGGQSKKGVRPELNIFWHDNGHSEVGEDESEGGMRRHEKVMRRSPIRLLRDKYPTNPVYPPPIPSLN